jgi:hypothetical protein
MTCAAIPLGTSWLVTRYCHDHDRYVPFWVTVARDKRPRRLAGYPVGAAERRIVPGAARPTTAGRGRATGVDRLDDRHLGRAPPVQRAT